MSTPRATPPQSERSIPDWSFRMLTARRARGISQAKLATLISASQSAIADYERGRSKPSFEIMMKIANALNVESRWLSDGTSSSSRGPEDLDVPSIHEWTDSNTFDSAYDEMCFQLRNAYSRAGLNHIEPITFAIACRQIWRAALVMPANLPLAERVDMMVKQIAVLLPYALPKAKVRDTEETERNSDLLPQ